MKKILALSYRVAISWVEKFSHNIPCQMPLQSLSRTVLMEESMSCTVRGPFIQPKDQACFCISWDGSSAVLNLWPWGFNSDPAHTLASPWALLPSLQKAAGRTGPQRIIVAVAQVRTGESGTGTKCFCSMLLKLLISRFGS